jgi:hypothetical protein
MKNFKTFMEDKTLKDIVKREKESSHSGSNTSKSIRTMTKEIKREKSDDLIIVNLSDDGDSVRRIEKDSSKLTGLLKKGWEKIK